MGTPKALLLFDDEPLVIHVVNTLKRLFGDIVVVAAPGQDLPAMDVKLVRDAVAYQGPVGGMCYGLAATAGDVSFVTSCDSAFLNTHLISHLLSRISGHDVVVPHWQGRLQPLHAVYRRTVLPLLEDQLARQELRPVYLFEKVRTRQIDEDEIRRFDPDGASFFNMNTREDYAEALVRWRDARRPRAGPPGTIHCTIELFGVARLLAKTSRIALAVPAGATFAQVFAALTERVPALAGRVITADGTQLVEGYACNVNGLEFVRRSTATVNAGDDIIILPADAGG